MSNLCPKKWSRSLEKSEHWSLTRDFWKQYLTEKQTGYLQSGRLCEVVAYKKWSLGEILCVLTYESDKSSAPCFEPTPFKRHVERETYLVYLSASYRTFADLV